MTDTVDPTEIEKIVGTERKPGLHIARAISAEHQVYILHSQECLDSGIYLTECPYSQALDKGIDDSSDLWAGWVDRPIVVRVGMLGLTPVAPVDGTTSVAQQMVCEGGSVCPALVHQHGCLADRNGDYCDHPENHRQNISQETDRAFHHSLTSAWDDLTQRFFEQVDERQKEFSLTDEQVTHLLHDGYGDVIADNWQDWVADGIAEGER